VTTKLQRWRECCCAEVDERGSFVNAEEHERVVAELEAAIAARDALIAKFAEKAACYPPGPVSFHETQVAAPTWPGLDVRANPAVPYMPVSWNVYRDEACFAVVLPVGVCSTWECRGATGWAYTGPSPQAAVDAARAVVDP